MSDLLKKITTAVHEISGITKNAYMLLRKRSHATTQ